MSSGNDTSKRSVDDEDDRGTKLIKTEAALVEQQPQKPDDDTMGVGRKLDVSHFLECCLL